MKSKIVNCEQDSTMSARDLIDLSTNTLLPTNLIVTLVPFLLTRSAPLTDTRPLSNAIRCSEPVAGLTRTFLCNVHQCFIKSHIVRGFEVRLTPTMMDLGFVFQGMPLSFCARVVAVRMLSTARGIVEAFMLSYYVNNFVTWYEAVYREWALMNDC